MPTGLKALIVIITLALLAFAGGKKICRRYMSEAAFCRRRNVWFALTILSFALPSFWLYTVISMPLIFMAARRDENPLALYTMLMFVVPNDGLDLPTIGGIGQLFQLTHLRVLSFVILLPLILRPAGESERARNGFTVLDWLVLAYCALQIALFIPYESLTNTLRRTLLQFLDTFLVFYAFSRIGPKREALYEVVVSFAMALGVIALIAIFESLRGWQLYASVPDAWGAQGFAYRQRGDSLRAQVTTGHSLVLGYVMCLAIGFWAFIQAHEPSMVKKRVVTVVFWAALAVSYSRGAWLSGALVLAIFLALRPGAAGLLVKVVPALIAAGALIYVSPLKEVLIDRLPFIGSSDQDSVTYRQELLAVSWRLIQLNPLLGDPFVTRNMEELKQGEGIIDIINAYVAVTLFSGFVGLTLFTSAFVIALQRGFASMRNYRAFNQTASIFGASLVACMAASLFFMATAGVGSIQYALAGLLASYALTRAVRLSLPTRDERLAGVGR